MNLIGHNGGTKYEALKAVVQINTTKKEMESQKKKMKR